MEENSVKVENSEKIVESNKSNAEKVAEKILEIDSGVSDLEALKECYRGIQKKYDLPSFEDLNYDFNIEKIQGEETDFLIREVRKYISDKFAAYLRLVETFLQPTNAQMFVFMMLKSVTNEDKEMLQSVYKKLAKKEIELIELDLEYNIDKEVEFINSAYMLWQDVKIELLDLIVKVKGEFGNGGSQNSSRRYFG